VFGPVAPPASRESVGIVYNEDQRTATEVYYANPSDLFLNGVTDTRQGNCGVACRYWLASGLAGVAGVRAVA
jgi:hypothetical protein